MATVKEIIDVYSKNPKIKSIIDAHLKGFKEQYEEVVIVSDGTSYIFKRVTNLENITNYTIISENTYRVTHSDMFCGNITDLQTEIEGVLKIKTRKIGERKYQGE